MTKEEEGVSAGETCNRKDEEFGICKSILQRQDEKNCSCHICPPCSNCVDAIYYCPGCGWTSEKP